ncbi:MAG TPA: type VI secretion system baseplate subunit TssG, partial [Rhizomicrobium sp.]
MAAEDGIAPDHLSFLRRAAADAPRYGIFALLRQAEARAPGLPQIGRARLPERNIVDLAHNPTLDFPGPTVDSIAFGAQGRAKVTSLFLGLTGPMGALPLHLSEFANNERRNGHKQPFGRFLDLLTDRMLQFFYRAWADTQPAAHSDRPADDRFAAYIAAICGIKQDGREGFPYFARIYHAGLFASRRGAAVIVDALTDLLRTRVSIREFVPRWRDIAPADRTRIGMSGAFNRLGGDAVLGRRVRTIDDSFRIAIHCADRADYGRYLPVGGRFAVVRDVLDTLAPPHLEWQLQLEIAERKIAGARLDGTTPLGWAAWVAPRGGEGMRADARLGRRA